MTLKLREDPNGIVAEQLWRVKANVFSAEQQTPIFYEGYIYGVRQDGQLVCLSTDGEVVWASGKANKFGLGPYIIADGMIYVMNNSGLLTITEASTAGYKVLDQAKVLEGPESWGPPALVSGRLIVRDLNRMICLDVSGQ
jgi:outer membrane protein assembly factor BamB